METRARTRSRWALPGARPLVALTAGMVLATLTTTASASVVIHDSTWMTDANSYDSWIQSNIAGATSNPQSNIVDHNAAANFMVGGGSHNVTSVTGDFIASVPWFGQGVLVEFFADVGNAPSNTPTAQFFATKGSGLSVSSFDNHLFGWEGIRFNIDLTEAGVTLNEGSWWLSIVAVHETLPTQSYLWVRQENFQKGGELHIRKGSQAHGNDHGGTWGTFDWAPISQQLGLPPGDPAFAVMGTALPAPGAITLLVMAGLGLRSRRRI